jgi:drug/metabolite transporter (DMT)-like permease
VFHGIKRHHSWVPASVFASGIGLIVGSHFVLESGSFQPVGIVMAILGGLAVGGFHFVNRRMQHRGCNCDASVLAATQPDSVR